MSPVKLLCISIQNMCAFPHFLKECLNVSVSYGVCLVTDKGSQGPWCCSILWLIFSHWQPVLTLYTVLLEVLFWWMVPSDKREGKRQKEQSTERSDIQILGESKSLDWHWEEPPPPFHYLLVWAWGSRHTERKCVKTLHSKVALIAGCFLLRASWTLEYFWWCVAL